MKTESTRKRTLLLASVAVAQLALLAWILLNNIYPLWCGQEVILGIRPVDPRSLFRGQYVRLNYDIRTISRDLISEDELKELRFGKDMYVLLEKSNNNIWKPKSASLCPPKEGVYIKGWIENMKSEYQVEHSAPIVRYGIEAYFASAERALDIEKKLRVRRGSIKPAYVKVRIATNGKAALEELGEFSELNAT